MINLLPPEQLINMRLARSNTILRRYIELALLSLLALAIVICGAYYFLNRQKHNTNETVQLNEQKIKQLEPIQKQAEGLSNTINTIASLSARDVRFSDLLTKIGSLMPQGSVLTGMQFSIEDLKSPLVVSAQVDSTEKAAILRNNLAASGLFSRADIQTINQGDSTTTSGTSGVPTIQSPDGSSQTANSQYPYTAVINAYFKDAKAISSGGGQ